MPENKPENELESQQKNSSQPNLKPLFMIILVTIAIPIFLIAPRSQSQSPPEIKKEEEEVRKVMRLWSRQLGVTCTTCHDSNNFRSDKLRAFKIGREHMKLTQVLIDNGMDGKKGPKADCFMCHRGDLKPNYKEP